MELLIENNESINLYEYLNLNDFPYKERLFMNKYLRDINFKDESITKDVDYGRLTFHDVLSPKIETLLDEFHFNIAAIKEIANAAYSIYESVVINKNLLEEQICLYPDEKITIPLSQLSTRDDQRLVIYNLYDDYFKHVILSTYQNGTWIVRLSEQNRAGFEIKSSEDGIVAEILDVVDNPIGLRFTYDNKKQMIKLETADRNSKHNELIDKNRYLGDMHLPLMFDYHFDDNYRYEIEETPVERIHKYICEIDNQFDDVQTIYSIKVGQKTLKQIDKVTGKDIIEVVHTNNEKENILEFFNPSEGGKFAYDYKRDVFIYSRHLLNGELTLLFRRVMNTRQQTAALAVAEQFVHNNGKKYFHRFPLSLSEVPMC